MTDDVTAELPASAPDNQESGPERRRGLRIAVIVAGSLVLILAALAITDSIVRAQIASRVADKTRTTFHLPDSTAVAVDVGGFSAIYQLAVGRIDSVTVEVSNLALGEVRGEVGVIARGIPTDLDEPIEHVAAEFRIPESTVQALMGFLSVAVLNNVELVEPEVRIGSEFTVPFTNLGFSIGIGLEPYSHDGHLGFTPTSFEFAGERTTAQELIDQFGGVAEAILATRSFCVAGWLPSRMTVDDARVRGSEIVVILGAEHQRFTEEALAIRGSCDT